LLVPNSTAVLPFDLAMFVEGGRRSDANRARCASMMLPRAPRILLCPQRTPSYRITVNRRDTAQVPVSPSSPWWTSVDDESTICMSSTGAANIVSIWVILSRVSAVWAPLKPSEKLQLYLAVTKCQIFALGSLKLYKFSASTDNRSPKRFSRGLSEF
jgi:hypothetical protein